LDDAAHAEGRARLERRIVEAVASGSVTTPRDAGGRDAPPVPGLVPVLLSLALAVVAGGYVWLGRPDALDLPGTTAAGPTGPGAATPEAAPHTMDTAQMRQMVDSLAQRLAADPADAEGWAMLARSWVVLGEPGRAVQAYRQALDAGVKDAALLADFADALAVADGHRIEGEALQRVQQALALDPDQPKALSLAGTAAFDRGDYAGAVTHWAHLQAVGPPDHPLVQQMTAGLSEARQRLAAAGGRVASTAAASPPSAAAFVAGTVQLDPALAPRTRPDDTVFVFARAASGPRMPLAVMRAQVKDLPMRFRLDDSLAMSPAFRLSSHDRVVVGARISRSGQATAQPGEPRVESSTVALGRNDIQLMLVQGTR
ncbi:MAG: hypothetical protein KDG57_19895, partial [Rhodoferax sp.]|nr:hypothetical protein [Rhodoferax sp.]